MPRSPRALGFQVSRRHTRNHRCSKIPQWLRTMGECAIRLGQARTSSTNSEPLQAVAKTAGVGQKLKKSDFAAPCPTRLQGSDAARYRCRVETTGSKRMTTKQRLFLRAAAICT